MAINYLLDQSQGKKVLLLGNEAFARGALEANVQVAVGYPGTPSSEIIESMAKVAQEAGIYTEWSVNEKVAFEVAYAAAVGGLRSVVTFKSVGLNVAADSLFVANSAGIEGGFVIITADDPSGHSSQNEQDCRYMAKMAEIPCFEPSDPQEAKDMILQACALSEFSKLPVIVRSVTRLSHVRGDVELGPLNLEKRVAKVSETAVYSGFPCLERHIEHHQRLNSISESQFPFSQVEANGGEKVGLIVSGVGYAYGKEVVRLLQIEEQVAILKLGLVNPLPLKKLGNFLQSYDSILVLEDGFPYLEEEVSRVCYEGNWHPQIFGKLSGHLPREGELTPELVAHALAQITGVEDKVFSPSQELSELQKTAPKAPSRVLSLCSGCAHMAMWSAMKRAVTHGRQDIRRGAVVCGDIGCYGLGLFPNYHMFNTHVCMGASIGVANGMSKLNLDKPVFAYLGEGTFFHSGMPALQNAVFNWSKMVVIIQDNLSTAMTGHQENPGVGHNLMGQTVPQIRVEKVAEAMGVPYVKVVDPYNLSEVISSIKEGLTIDGPAVIVGRRKCAELAKRELKRQGQKIVPPTIDASKCNGCKICVNELLCPALIWNQEQKMVSIDSMLCVSCTVCGQVCPSQAITGGRGVAHV